MSTEKLDSDFESFDEMKKAQEIINESGFDKSNYEELEYTYRAVESRFLSGMKEFEVEFGIQEVTENYWDYCPTHIKISYLSAKLNWMIAGRLLYGDGAEFCSVHNIEYTYNSLAQLRGDK